MPSSSFNLTNNGAQNSSIPRNSLNHTPTPFSFASNTNQTNNRGAYSSAGFGLSSAASRLGVDGDSSSKNAAGTSYFASSMYPSHYRSASSTPSTNPLKNTQSSSSHHHRHAFDIPRDSLDFPAAVSRALAAEDSSSLRNSHVAASNAAAVTNTPGAATTSTGATPSVATANANTTTSTSASSAFRSSNAYTPSKSDAYTALGLFRRPQMDATRGVGSQRRYTTSTAADSTASRAGPSLRGTPSVFDDNASVRSAVSGRYPSSTPFRDATQQKKDSLSTAGRPTGSVSAIPPSTSRSLRYGIAGAQDLRSPLQRDPHGQHGDNLAELDPRWVTIFGFPPEKASYILRQFSHYGEILQYHITGNWMNVEFRTESVAQKALAKNGKIFDNNIMIGVVECLNPKSSAYSPLEYEQKERTTMWKFQDQGAQEKPSLGARAAAKKRRFESIYQEDSAAAIAEQQSRRPKKRPRQQESWFQSLMDYILKF